MVVLSATADRTASRTVWEAGGCESWYRIGGSGRVAVKWPGSLDEFEEAVLQVHPDDYRLIGVQETATALS